MDNLDDTFSDLEVNNEKLNKVPRDKFRTKFKKRTTLVDNTLPALGDGCDKSLALRILEEDFSQVIRDLNRHDRLGHYSNEFQRVMDALRDSQAREHELAEKNKALRQQVISDVEKLAAAAKLSQADQDTIEKLQEEVEKTWRIVDTAQTREQLAQETIENLRLQSSRLAQELETLRKMGSDQEQEVGALSKNKEALAREKERLLGEITHAREKYAAAMKYQEELEKRSDAAELKLAETTTELEAQKSELAKEKRFKEKLEEEVKELKSDVTTKEQEILNLTNQGTQSTKMVAKLEHQVREEKVIIEKQNKELQELQNTMRLIKMEYEQLLGKYEGTQQDLAAKNQDLRMKDEEVSKMKTEMKKLLSSKDSLENKYSLLTAEKGNLEMKKKELQTKQVTLEKEILDMKKLATANKKVIDEMTREKDVMTRTVQKAAAHASEQQKLMSLQEFNKKKIQEELNEQMENVTKQKNEISTLQNEKDRLFVESITLNNQIQDQVEELKLKEMELFDYKKRIATVEAKMKLQLAMFEQVRSERNQLSKSLTEASDEINELKHKLKIKSYQVEQLKEDIGTKESQLVKEEFALKKMAKEKEEVKTELQKTLNALREKKEQVAVLTQEENRLQKIIQEADKEKTKLNKDLNQVSNERDILGTQLVRRNDELSLLYEKIKIFQSILEKGEAQYDQRVEDICLLKIEIKKLRQEKAMLARSMNNVSDLRQELFHLERDFTRERLKCRALEEELQNPLNVHRWRKLEGSDPTTFELIQKIHILQKRLLVASEEAIKRESRLKETERLYVNLRQVLARQPGPETFGKLRKCQNALRSRGRKMKCLIAELTMYENQISGFKFEKEQTDKEVVGLKKKYLSLKKREQKVKQREKELAHEKTFLPVLEPITGKPSKAKFIGAGFNVGSVTCMPRTPSIPMNA